MQLKAFDRNGYVEVSINESELEALCNALYEYFEVHQPENIDKHLYEIRRQLYIIYEVSHGAYFDETTLRILEKMQPKEKQ